MPVTVRSFAKINLGLRIGKLRPDGFHELHTIYQTIALHDAVRVDVKRGDGIEICCPDPGVPADQTNTCYRVAERVLRTLSARVHVMIEIEKRLPVQGGLGGASGNAVATLLALELALRKSIPHPEKLRIAAEVGSDLPLFLVGGTVLGIGRGEEVFPLPDLASTICLVATPEIGVSTPKAFADWDLLMSESERAMQRAKPELPNTPSDIEIATSYGALGPQKLTSSSTSDRMMEFSRAVSSWLSGLTQKSGKPLSGVPAKGRGRAETPLLDLVRTGIENDFESVVFPQYPELREVKSVLERAGATYASLSGSGSAIYGLFRTRTVAAKAATKLRRMGIPAQVTSTLTRPQYWKKVFDC
jgi:4-diphosphocytidyl-2-C-methyl-D-erythritol kinase